MSGNHEGRCGDVVEHFFGVYLLYCLNPQFVGRTYIGYTVNPDRRIRQHNAGKDHGGAWRTSNRGPWKMILVVHGFLNSTSALRFEWAWQHPHLSRRLRHFPRKRAYQRKFDYCLTILSEMLNLGPWSRLPLTVRWLDARFAAEYSAMVSPPRHMPIREGKVVARKIRKDGERREIARSIEAKTANDSCALCGETVQLKERIACFAPNCRYTAHLICLAGEFCGDGMLLPVEGTCPNCDNRVLWGDLVKKKVGCGGNFEEMADDVAFDGDGDGKQDPIY